MIPDDDLAQRVLELLLEQLRDSAIPQQLVGGAWDMLCPILNQRPALGPAALELDIFGVAIAQLRAIGSDGSWVVSLSSVSLFGWPVQHSSRSNSRVTLHW